MLKPTKTQAKAFLQEALDGIPRIEALNHSSTQFITWRRDAQVAINHIFGSNSRHAEEFSVIRYYSNIADSQRHRVAFRNGLSKASAILQSMITEVDRWWTEGVQTLSRADVPGVKVVAGSNRVFVVHGRDEAAKHTVARYLEGLELDPVILQEQPSEGRTIIEKFEEYAEVGFAVVLCTPDDVGALESEQQKLKPRPRQNVVLEWGFFLGKIGRNRVCALFKDDVEIPSDYDGVIYIQLDDFGGWRMELAKEMRAAGLPVDMNQL